MSANQGLIEAERLGAGYNVSFTDSASTPQSLAPGRWSVIATEDCFVKLGASNVAAVADANSFFVPAIFAVTFIVSESDRIAGQNYISVIRLASNGTAYIRKVSR
jgi:hypothetical protein